MTETLFESGFSIENIDGISVAIGPGSFTGLRVGLAAAKGICWARRLPLAGVSSIEALAACATTVSGEFLVVKDAKKNEYYYGGFVRSADNLTRILADNIGTADDIARLVDQKYDIVGPGIPALKKKERFAIDLVDDGYEREAVGGQVARIGFELIAAKKTIDPITAAPVYIRTPAYVRSEA